jgi:hypothetical protein
MTTLSLAAPLPVAVPRAAPVAAYYFLMLLRALSRASQARQASTALARRLKDAAQLRAYAMGLQHTDPRMAADLLAAADRHTAPD